MNNIGKNGNEQLTQHRFPCTRHTPHPEHTNTQHMYWAECFDACGRRDWNREHPNTHTHTHIKLNSCTVQNLPLYLCTARRGQRVVEGPELWVSALSLFLNYYFYLIHTLKPQVYLDIIHKHCFMGWLNQCYFAGMWLIQLTVTTKTPLPVFIYVAT